MLIRLARSIWNSGALMSLLDQGVVSLSNFLTAMLLAKSLGPDAYGEYSLLTTTALAINGMASVSLVISPLRVLGVSLAEKELDVYFSNQWLFQTVLSVAVALMGSAFLVYFYRLDADVCVVFVVFAVISQLQEFGRSCNTTSFKWHSLLASDLIAHGGRLVVLGVAIWQHDLSVTLSLLIISLAYALGSLVTPTGSARFAPDLGRLRESWERNWAFGKWLTLESVVFTVSVQIYVYLVASFIDVRSAGAFSAAQVLLNSLNVLLVGVINFAVPKARKRLLEQGYASWARWWRQVATLLFVITFIASIGLSLYAAPLLSMLFQPAYGSFAYLVPILGIALAFTAMTTTFSAALRTVELPQVGFTAKLISAAVTLGIAHPLIDRWGVAGAAIGTVATQLCWVIVYVYSLRSRREHTREMFAVPACVNRV